jgi:hypothetical protein
LFVVRECKAGVTDMTDVIKVAAMRSSKILNETDHACDLIQSTATRPRINTLGVLDNPARYLSALHQARAAIERAIALHSATNWPGPQDYHAL